MADGRDAWDSKGSRSPFCGFPLNDVDEQQKLLIGATHGGRVSGRISARNKRKDRTGNRRRARRNQRALVSDGAREPRTTEGAGGGHFRAFTLPHTTPAYWIQPFRISVDYAGVCIAQQLSRTPRFDNIREMPPSFVVAASSRTRHALWTVLYRR